MEPDYFVPSFSFIYTYMYNNIVKLLVESTICYTDKTIVCSKGHRIFRLYFLSSYLMQP